MMKVEDPILFKNIEMDINTEFKIKQFEEYVCKHFGFLEKLHFERGKIERVDFEYPQDMHVEIEYCSDKIFVVISWYLIESNIGVGISELYNGKKHQKYSAFGDKGYGRGIILYDLVEYLTKGNVKRPCQSKAIVEEIMDKSKPI